MHIQSPALNAADSALLELVRMLRDGGYRFVTVTPETHRRVNSRAGNLQARSLEDIFGWSRPFDPVILVPELYGLMQAAGVVMPDALGARSLVRISSLGDDLFLHSAFPTLAADAVFFGPDTYRFARTLGGHLSAGPQDVRRAVDIGCGSGAGGICVARACPQAEVLLVDINDMALRFSRLNARLAGVDNVLERRSDLLRDVEGAFDLIVANPPYLVDPLERAYRDGGGPLGAGLSLAIVDAAAERLAPGGTLLLYTGAAVLRGKDPFRDAAAAALDAAGLAWAYEEIDPDVFGEELMGGPYADADRIAVVLLTARKPGAKSPQP